MPAALTFGGDAFAMHASGSESERAELYIILCFRRFLHTNWVGERERMPAFLYSQRWHFWYACQRIWKASAMYIFLVCTSPVQCLRTECRGGGRKGCWRVLISEVVRLVCMLGGREREHIGRSVSRIWLFNFP